MVDFVGKPPIMFCNSQQSDAMVRQVFGEVFAIDRPFPEGVLPTLAAFESPLP